MHNVYASSIRNVVTFKLHKCLNTKHTSGGSLQFQANYRNHKITVVKLVSVTKHKTCKIDEYQMKMFQTTGNTEIAKYYQEISD